MISSRTKALELTNDILVLIENAPFLQALAKECNEAQSVLRNAQNYVTTTIDEMSGSNVKENRIIAAQQNVDKITNQYNIFKEAIQNDCRTVELKKILDQITQITEADANTEDNIKWFEELHSDLTGIKEEIKKYLNPNNETNSNSKLSIENYITNCFDTLQFIQDAIKIAAAKKAEAEAEKASIKNQQTLYHSVISEGYDAFAEADEDFALEYSQRNGTTDPLPDTTVITMDSTPTSHDEKKVENVSSTNEELTKTAETTADLPQQPPLPPRHSNEELANSTETIPTLPPQPPLQHRSSSAPTASEIATMVAPTPMVPETPKSSTVTVIDTKASPEKPTDKTKKVFNTIKSNMAMQITMMQNYIHLTEKVVTDLTNNSPDPATKQEIEQFIKDAQHPITLAQANKAIKKNKQDCIQTMIEHSHLLSAILEELNTVILPDNYDQTYNIIMKNKVVEFNTTQDNAKRVNILEQLYQTVLTLKADAQRTQQTANGSKPLNIDAASVVTALANTATGTNTGVVATGAHSGKIGKRNPPAAPAPTTTIAPKQEEKRVDDNQSDSEKKVVYLIQVLENLALNIQFQITKAKNDNRDLKLNLVEAKTAAKSKNEAVAKKNKEKARAYQETIKTNNEIISQLPQERRMFENLILEMNKLLVTLAAHRDDMNHEEFCRRMRQFQNLLNTHCKQPDPKYVNALFNEITKQTECPNYHVETAKINMTKHNNDNTDQPKPIDNALDNAKEVKIDDATAAPNAKNKNINAIAPQPNIVAQLEPKPLENEADNNIEEDEKDINEEEEKEVKYDPTFLPKLQSYCTKMDEAVHKGAAIVKDYETAIKSAVIASDPLKNKKPLERYGIIYAEENETKPEKRNKKLTECIEKYENVRSAINKINNRDKSRPTTYPKVLKVVENLKNLHKKLEDIIYLLDQHSNNKMVKAFFLRAASALPPVSHYNKTEEWSIAFAKWTNQYYEEAADCLENLEKQKAKAKQAKKGNTKAPVVERKEEKQPEHVVAPAPAVINNPTPANDNAAASNDAQDNQTMKAPEIKTPVQNDASLNTAVQAVNNLPDSAHPHAEPKASFLQTVWNYKFAILMSLIGAGAGAAVTFFTLGLGSMALLYFVSAVASASLSGAALFGLLGHTIDISLQQKSQKMAVENAKAEPIASEQPVVSNDRQASEKNTPPANNQQPLLQNDNAKPTTGERKKSAPVDPNSVNASQNPAALHKKRPVIKHKTIEIDKPVVKLI